ncbi:hypothetical protein CU669_15605 [Paramagnetospirillum kuznetsovii]|uniref:HEAT repeat domain-containing protein n=1 Tax=Paramagnetospirillum kuznetsovii TaxID=2053833 RepID=A0A364NVE9_9PROT|nr:hypothetical protein [Paramagnetospirillum kuznetsovii]RAU21036.1 hypothetical protein CU669_15605 [Paramagnetospirillum kuznetsovii]
MRGLFGATALLLAVATPAMAALEAKHYVARRVAAEHHLQIAVSGVEDQAGTCRVTGEVVRAFLSRGERFRPGSDVVFALPCGADAFWPQQRLVSAKMVEAFIKSSTGALEAADDGQGMRALDAATDTPTIRDDPALVREATESIAVYSIDAEIKRNNPDGALALARVDDRHLRLRLLAHVVGGLVGRKSAALESATAEMLAAFDGLAADDARLEAGLLALEPLALGGASDASLKLAERLALDVDALTIPSARDAALLSLYGARTRAEAPAAALTALAKVSNPKLRRDHLEDMPFAQKDFGPANPASLIWMDQLLAAAESQADPAFRQEALTALCRTAYRSAGGLAEIPELVGKAVPMAELAAKRHHGPSAVLLAVLTELLGGSKARPEAARWYAVAGVGFDVANSARAEAIKILSSFTPAERAAAARLLGGSGAASPQKLLELAKK